MSETAATDPTTPLQPPVVAYAPARGDSLGRRAVRNSLWTVGSYVLANFVRLSSNLILTRLLVPQYFGVMTVVTTVLVGIRLFSDVGIGPGVISSPRGNDDRFLRTAYAMQIMRGCFIWLAACALAYPVTQSYLREDPIYGILSTLIPIAAFVAVIEGFRSTAVFRLQRNLDVKKIAAIDLIEILTTTTTMVIWASIHPSIWALAIPPMVGSTMSVVVSHFLMRDRRDWPKWDRECAQELMKIGRWIFLSTALTFLAGQFDRLIFAKLIGPATLGVFAIAVNLAIMPLTAIAKIGGAVLFPTFSRVADDFPRFADIYVRARTVLLAMGGLTVCSLVAASPFAVKMMYRSEYDAAGWMLQLLAIGLWFQIVDATNTAALLAQRQPRWMAAGNLTKVVFLFTLVPTVFHMGYGFSGALIALGVSDGLRMLTSTIGMMRLGIPKRALLADLAFPILIAALGLFAFQITSYWTGFVESLFPATRIGRGLSNLVLCAIAMVQVLAIFVPIALHTWKKARRAQDVRA